MEAQGMIEKVARALAAHIHENGDYGMSGDDAYASRPSEFEGMARAAIKAIRIPSKAMLHAVEKIEDERYVGYERMPAEEAWPIMVDAALNEQEKG